MDELLLTILDNHDAEKLTVDCKTYEERAETLRILRDYGCDINDGRNRDGYINGENRNFSYPSPEFTDYGGVSCRVGTLHEDGISYAQFLEEVMEIENLRSPLTPPEIAPW